jgi:hypothetical protein
MRVNGRRRIFMKRLMTHQYRSGFISLMAMFVFGAVWIGFIPQSFAATHFQVTRAEWKADDGALKLKGYGAGGKNIVTVKNANTGETLGTTRSEDDGKFEFSKEHLSSVPSALVVMSGSRSVTIGFTEATRKSGGPAVLILTAEWRASERTLLAKGTGPSRSEVAFFAVESGSEMGSTRIESDGKWENKFENPSSMPCRIQIQTDGAVAEMAVKNAPEDCGEVTSPGDPLLTEIKISGPSEIVEKTQASYVAVASYQDGTSAEVTPTWSENSSFASISSNGLLTAGTVTANQSVSITASYSSSGTTVTATKSVSIVNGTAAAEPKSITSTSQNRDTLPIAAVPEQPFTNLPSFSILAVNDLGMHCGDLDHRVASILPPFNVLHALVIQKGTSNSPPRILTPAEVQVFYSAASNPNDPALQSQPSAPIFKTNFWDPNPANPSSTIAFDGFDPFYPPSVLSPSVLYGDNGLPSPDLAALYPVSGAGELIAYQQNMPGISNPYVANTPQPMERFDTDLPFFVNFPFGYDLTDVNWFAADGIPMTPYDDFGRKNSFPLMRVQAISSTSSLTGTANEVVASLDTVIPVSAEADCAKCHTSATDGGNGQAACVPGVDPGCSVPGSARSGTAFDVAIVSHDVADVPLEVSKEWAADTNIIRLHDAKHGTQLEASTPVVCQTCHYTPALDLAHLGPLGPEDAAANGRDQKVHQTNSRVIHAFHARFTDLFADDMPAPTDPRRTDPATGKPTANTFVQDKLNQSCYQCHPGRDTKCLRGAMFNGGLICQDCHGGMRQVGDDFSEKFSNATPFPQGADLTKRIPWATTPACQSCHTGDALDNIGMYDNQVIKAKDGIRLLQAYRTNDTANATPISATNKRFAENESNGNRVLYRYSKGHGDLACEVCHGSTHAEWPVQPESGAYVANDNMAAIQLQGHTGKIIECSACHTETLPASLDGPHGMHPVGATRFADGGHESLAEHSGDRCRACHGANGEGTVLSVVATSRSLSVEGHTVSLAKGEMVSCDLCHENKLR